MPLTIFENKILLTIANSKEPLRKSHILYTACDGRDVSRSLWAYKTFQGLINQGFISEKEKKYYLTEIGLLYITHLRQAMDKGVEA